MDLKITFRHMDHTESIDQMIKEKIKRFSDKHLTQNASIQWTCLVEHDEHQSSVHVKDKSHEFHVRASSDNMYKTIDQAIHKLSAQVSHEHSQRRA